MRASIGYFNGLLGGVGEAARARRGTGAVAVWHRPLPHWYCIRFDGAAIPRPQRVAVHNFQQRSFRFSSR